MRKVLDTLGNPTLLRSVNGWLAILWVGMIPVSLLMHWLSSVTYVAALSIWALVSGHWSAWQAARVEVKQDESGVSCTCHVDDDPRVT